MSRRFRRLHDALSQLPPADRSIACAVSGGSDSMALLHALLPLSRGRGIPLEAMHIEHGIRGAASVADAARVAVFCRELGISLHIAHADVPEYARARGIGLETAARQVRYAMLQGMMARAGASYCVLAHHLEDQAETLLINLTRGSGARGLAGMRGDRGWLQRPWLGIPRELIRAYADAHRLPYADDITNALDDNPRNAIRLRVMPELRAINPSAASALGRAAKALAEDDDALSAYASAALRDRLCGDALDVRRWDAPRAVVKRAIQRCLIAWGGRPEATHLDVLDGWMRAEGTPPRKLDLPGLTVRLRRGILTPCPGRREEGTPCHPSKCAISPRS